MTLSTRSLGPDLVVSAQGLGCMGMGYAYDAPDVTEAIATIHRGLELGVTFLDTADVYGMGANERLVGRAIEGHRDEVVLATKFGITPDPSGSRRAGVNDVNGRPEYVHAAIDASLERLGVDHVDIYYQHRADPNVPIEETIGAMADLVSVGKVGHLGLSEASADTIRRAATVHAISALQSEWSLFSRDIEADVVPVCRELGIGIVSYSPLGRGLLTGTITSTSQLEANDFRRTLPRFEDHNLDANLKLVEVIRSIANDHGSTPAQIALSWVQQQGDDVVPIPGTKRRRYLEENVAALLVTLTADELDRLGQLPALGDRYPNMAWIDRSTRPLPA